jgi:replicative DNA helicase
LAGIYDFSGSFQEKILALTWREPSFFLIYKDCIKPQFFESDMHMDLSRILIDYYEKYELAPTLEAVVEEVRVLTSGSKLKKEKAGEYLETVSRLVELDLSDASYVKDKIVAFGRKQALTEAILKSVDDLKKASDFSIIEQRIKEANQVGQDIGDFGTFYFEDIDSRLERYDKRDTEKIPTGIDLLDKVMAGGLGRGELGIVIAPPGTGKTLSLINIGANGIMQGKNVAHFSLEMSEERVTQRYDSTFTDKDFAYIKANKESVAKALGMLSRARKGKLVVKSYPTRTCTIDMIKSYLSRIKLAKGFVPDLIIIDYPDLMRPTATYKERRTELEILYEELRGLAQAFDCACWGASQTNRGALEKKVVTIADLAESFGKAAVADFMIAISQTKDEKKNNELRYYIAKSRNGESDYTVHCDVYYDRMKIRSNAERQLAFELADDEEDAGANNEQRKKRMEKEIRKKQQAETNVMQEVKDLMKKGEETG